MPQLSTAAIAGISVACVLVLLAIVGTTTFVIIKKRKTHVPIHSQFDARYGEIGISAPNGGAFSDPASFKKQKTDLSNGYRPNVYDIEKSSPRTNHSVSSSTTSAGGTSPNDTFKFPAPRAPPVHSAYISNRMEIHDEGQGEPTKPQSVHKSSGSRGYPVNDKLSKAAAIPYRPVGAQVANPRGFGRTMSVQKLEPVGREGVKLPIMLTKLTEEGKEGKGQEWSPASQRSIEQWPGGL